MLQTWRMKFLLLAVILLASCGAALPLQTPKPAEAGKTTAAPAPKTPDSAQLLEDVRVLSADAMEGRGAGTKGGAMARAYVARRLAEAGVKPLDKSFEQAFELPARAGDALGKPRRGVNLYGYVRGSARPERFIVVSAHYDHLGVRDGVIYNGADDNASGVAPAVGVCTGSAATHEVERMIASRNGFMRTVCNSPAPFSKRGADAPAAREL